MKDFITSVSAARSSKFLLILLLADLVFLLIHGLYLGHLVSDPLLSIEKESGYAEIYQYIKEFWIFILMLIIAVKEKRLIYFAWSLLFLYLLIDDAIAFHEKVGNYLTNYIEFKPVFNLKPADIGELCASAVFGFFLFASIFVSYLFSSPGEKKISKQLFILVLILAFFGVFFDMLHVAIHWGESVWGIIEDGGEMLVISVMVWFIFDLEVNKKDPKNLN